MHGKSMRSADRTTARKPSCAGLTRASMQNGYQLFAQMDHSSDFQNVKSLLHGIMDQLIAGPAVLLQLLHARAIDPHEFRYLAHFQRRMSSSPSTRTMNCRSSYSVIPSFQYFGANSQDTDLSVSLSPHGFPASRQTTDPRQVRHVPPIKSQHPGNNRRVSARLYENSSLLVGDKRARNELLFGCSFSHPASLKPDDRTIEMDKADDNACDSKRHGATCGAATASRCRLRRITS